MKGKTGFYIFCALAVLLVASLCWMFMDSGDDQNSEQNTAKTAVVAADEDVPPARVLLGQDVKQVALNNPETPKAFDEKLFVESLETGGVPTQDIGEKGSLEGAIATNYPMVYAPSKFDRLPDSPLIKFTDDMIHPDGKDGFLANKEALVDQAKHIQEASIALSVSPRVEMGKTTGYRLVEIPSDTLFSKMGMVSGDIIVSINGRLPDMEPMALMFVNMAAGKQGVSTIVVDHRGTERTIQLRATE